MSTFLDRKLRCYSQFCFFVITDDLPVGIPAKFDSAAVAKKKTKRTLFDKILKATTLTLPYISLQCCGTVR
jgi:hypothetical protein